MYVTPAPSGRRRDALLLFSFADPLPLLYSTTRNRLPTPISPPVATALPAPGTVILPSSITSSLPSHSLPSQSSHSRSSSLSFASATPPINNNATTRILLLQGFEEEMKTRDIAALFDEWEEDKGGFKIKWCDDSSCWIVFNDAGVGEYPPLSFERGLEDACGAGALAGAVGEQRAEGAGTRVDRRSRDAVLALLLRLLKTRPLADSAATGARRRSLWSIKQATEPFIGPRSQQYTCCRSTLSRGSSSWQQPLRSHGLSAELSQEGAWGSPLHECGPASSVKGYRSIPFGG